MKKIAFLFLLICLIISSVNLVWAQNTHLSDYQYQTDQYRQNYAEYQIYLKDYQQRQSLNNEQKALIAAKQTIVSRELALAHFYLILFDSINANKVEYPLINQALADLNSIAQYHFAQGDAATKLVTKTDLTNFSKSYLEKVATHRTPLAKAQVANKIAELLKAQLELKNIYNSLLPKLETKKDQVNVQSGLKQVEDYASQININIGNLAQEVSMMNAQEGSLSNFYTESSTSLAEIRDMQNRLVDILIELDTNYVDH